MKKKILLTGSNGQLGYVLLEKLNDVFGVENVLSSDIVKKGESINEFIILDVLDKSAIINVIEDFQITEIYHLAAILSAVGEKIPLKSWEVNFTGTLNVFDAAAKANHDVKVFFPSSIAVFGDSSPKQLTGQDVPLLPTSNYGMAKVAGELWANYYHYKDKLDIRGLRFPGIISYQSPPGGGTTDYAIEMYIAAVKGEDYISYIDKDTRLPMMYIDDAMDAVVSIMEQPSENIKCRTAYNLAAISFTPEELYHSILIYFPEFKVSYKPDFRQAIADSWTESIDDSIARTEWKWDHKYGLDKMTKIMIDNLKIKLNTAVV